MKSLVEEATFDATGEGLSFSAMDPSHVALVDLSWPLVAFSRYECDKPFKFSVSVEDLVKLISRSDTKDSVEISSTAEQAIVIRFANGYRREFTLHLIESATSPAPLPKLEFDTKVTVSKAILDKILGDISVVSDQISVEASTDTLQFSGKSDVGKAEIKLAKSDGSVLEPHVSAASRATYSIDFLNSISKAMGGVTDTVQFEFSAKKPVRLTFALNSQGSQLRFFLAPRISD